MRADVLILGAGHYGVSLAYDLYQRGISFVLVGAPFSLWLNHTLPDTELRSDLRTSQIFSRDGKWDLMPYLRKHYPQNMVHSMLKGKIPVTIFRKYLQWIINSLPFHSINDRVLRLEKQDHHYRAVTHMGHHITSKYVVLATGLEHHCYTPEVLSNFASPNIVHSWEVSKYENWKDRRILIVGGGQSAAEACVHLERKNRIFWIHRCPLRFSSKQFNLPNPLFKLTLSASHLFYRLPFHRWIGKKALEATITPELQPFIMHPKIRRQQVSVEEIGLEMRDNHFYSQLLHEEFDHVIACTGFRHNLASLTFLAPELQAKIANRDGMPMLDYSYSTNVEGLYMVGGIAEATHGPAQRLMMGCQDATLKVGKSLIPK